MMTQMAFKFPNNYIFMTIPILLVIVLFLGARKKMQIIAKLRMGLAMKHEKLRIVFMFLGLVLICFSLLGPQQLDGKVEVDHNSLDIYILLDTSKSMLAEDISPNRLEREKQIVSQIVEQLEGDRVGFIPFSSSAYIQMPLTDDYDLANLFLKVVDTDLIGGGGSDVGKAVNLANKSFDRTSLGDKVILIISDGEENDNDSEAVLKKIMDDHLKVYTIGIGTAQGGLIPVYDDESNTITEYMKDQKGNHVISKLNDTTLKALAQTGNGQYYLASMNGGEAKEFLDDVASLKKNDSKTEEINHYKQLYQYFLGVGLLMFLVAYWVQVRRRSQ